MFFILFLNMNLKFKSLLLFLLLILATFSGCNSLSKDDRTNWNKIKDGEVYSFSTLSLKVSDTIDGQIDKNLDRFELKVKLLNNSNNLSLNDFKLRLVFQSNLGEFLYAKDLSLDKFTLEFENPQKKEGFIYPGEIVKIKFISSSTIEGDENFLIKFSVKKSIIYQQNINTPYLLDTPETILI